MIWINTHTLAVFYNLFVPGVFRFSGTETQTHLGTNIPDKSGCVHNLSLSQDLSKAHYEHAGIIMATANVKVIKAEPEWLISRTNNYILIRWLRVCESFGNGYRSM